MGDDVRRKLESEKLAASWSMLAEHHKRNAVLMVSQDLDLIDVGVAIAENDVARVSDWQKTSRIRRPTEGEIRMWEAQPNELFANFIIVQPFVLLQEILSPAN